MAQISHSSSDSEQLNAFFNRKALALRTLMPAIVDSAPKQVGQCWCVDVIPAIRQIITIDGVRDYKTMAKIANVPLVMPACQGLGLSLTIPIQVGDECLLAVCDRSIDQWQMAGGIQNPNDETFVRHHDLTDAVAIPAMLTTAALADYPSDAVRIGSEAVHVAVSQNAITASDGSGRWTLTGGTLKVEAPVEMTGEVSITGEVNVTGNITTTGTVTAKEFIKA